LPLAGEQFAGEDHQSFTLKRYARGLAAVTATQPAPTARDGTGDAGGRPVTG